MSLSAKDGNGDIPYETYDVQPGAGLIYYRMREVYRNGNVEASQIVSINIVAKQREHHGAPESCSWENESIFSSTIFLKGHIQFA